ncbi:MAG: hypothetical protein M1814_006571 [Vezdaea aestivalis]|nr:MAG: hypothetical protein M1814_006571 [Vezdaea aestivalis]
MASGDGGEPYKPKDTIKATMDYTAVVGGAGLLMSGVQNALSRQNVGTWSILSRYGATTATFAAVGGAFAFTSHAAANLREKDDNWNATIGGFFGGSMLGLRAKSMPGLLGYSAGTAILMSAFNYTGGNLSGYDKDYNAQDDFERKQALRRNRRQPIEGTIEELGEGRGIYGPGYEERRRERIKQRYGIDVPARKSEPS